MKLAKVNLSNTQKEILRNSKKNISIQVVPIGFGKSGYISKSKFIDFLKLQAKLNGKNIDHITSNLPLKEQKRRLLKLLPPGPQKYQLRKRRPMPKYSSIKVLDRIKRKYKMKKGKRGEGLLIIEDFAAYAIASKQIEMRPLTSNRYHGDGLGQIAMDALDMQQGLKRLTRDKAGIRQIKPNEKL